MVPLDLSIFFKSILSFMKRHYAFIILVFLFLWFSVYPMYIRIHCDNTWEAWGHLMNSTDKQILDAYSECLHAGGINQ